MNKFIFIILMTQLHDIVNGVFDENIFKYSAHIV
jgi:hypothetical protein